MLMTIDVGNTNITVGIFDKQKLVGNFRLTTGVMSIHRMENVTMKC